MKPILSFLAVITISLLACQKSENSEILGTWKMVEAYDKIQAQFLTPPPNPQDFVEVTFTNDKFYGHTVINAFGDGEYDFDENEITFGNYIITMALDDQWGQAFITVLNNCYSVSPQPCAPSGVSFMNNRMKISTPKMDITLERQ